MKVEKYILVSSFALCSVLFANLVLTIGSAQQVTQARQVADNQYQVGGVLYMQTAGEYRALAYQAFNLAKMSLDADDRLAKKLSKTERRKQRAVMVDIDETVLDNSPYQAMSIKNRTLFDLQSWYAWGELRQAKAIPGAVDFLNYANRKGVRVIYSSNRDEVQKQATLDNLKGVGFPNVSSDTVLLRTNDSSKEARRQMVSQKYRIVLLIGDNLIDFSSVFERKSVNERFAEVDKAKDFWGRLWIVLPNAMYGDWENALYDYKRLSETEKAVKRLDALVGY